MDLILGVILMYPFIVLVLYGLSEARIIRFFRAASRASKGEDVDRGYAKETGCAPILIIAAIIDVILLVFALVQRSQ